MIVRNTLLPALLLACPAVAAAAPPPPVVERAALGPDEQAALTTALRESPLGRGLAPRANGLTGDYVAKKALSNSVELEIKQVAIERAAAKLDQTMIAFLPQIQATAGYTRLSKAAINFGGGAGIGAVNGPPAGQDFAPVTVGPCPGGMGTCAVDPMGQPLVVTPPFQIEIPLNGFSMQAQLSVPISDYILSLVPAKRGSEAARDAAALAREAERVKVETDARLAYFNWLRGIAALLVMEDALERTQARLRDVENLFEAGSATRSDVLRVDALISSQQAALNDARAFREISERSLAIMMGEPVRSYEVGEDLLSPPKDLGPLPPLDDLVVEAHGNRRELKALLRTTDGIEQGIRATRAQYYPRLDAFAEATYANPNQRFFPLESVWRGSWSVGAQITYTINSTLATKARVRELKSDKRELQLQVEAMRRGIEMEVSQAYYDRARALAAIELDTRALASTAEAYRVATENFKAGAATTNEIIDAEGDQVQAGLRALNSRIDLRVASARLLYATGRLDPKDTAKP